PHSNKRSPKYLQADWSADGRDIALLTTDNKLIILSSNFQNKYHLQLPESLQMQISSADSNIKTH
ncbi:hypothetical protein KI387_024840, partial [Taxus chinensis]